MPWTNAKPRRLLELTLPRVAAVAPFRLLGQLDLGDQVARCRMPPGELVNYNGWMTIESNGTIPFEERNRRLDLIRAGR